MYLLYENVPSANRYLPLEGDVLGGGCVRCDKILPVDCTLKKA